MTELKDRTHGFDLQRYQERGSHSLFCGLTLTALAAALLTITGCQAQQSRTQTAPAKPQPSTQSSNASTPTPSNTPWYGAFSSIESMSAPDGWYIAPIESSPGCVTQRFKPAKDTSDFIDYFVNQYTPVNGIPDAREIKARREILDKDDHDLSEQEKASIPELLKYYNARSKQPSKIEKCMTQTLRGRRTFFIQASLPTNREEFEDGEKSYCYYVDSGMDGATMTEFYFTADPDIYEKYLPVVQKSMNSVEWKSK